MTNKVLVLPISAVGALGLKGRFTLEVAGVMEAVINPKVARFLDRPVAETSDAYRQVIPYVLLCSGDQVCTYVRGPGSGESRLAGKRSMGFGGHIIPKDRPSRAGPDWYAKAVRREVYEEVELKGSPREKIVGVIKDERSRVGRVHIGIVHVWEVDAASVRAREKQISSLAFMGLPELNACSGELESWSVLVLDVFQKANRREASGKKRISIFDLASGLR